MSRGGTRPGAGRPPGAKDSVKRKPKGGKQTRKTRKRKPKPSIPDDIIKDAKSANLDPLTYMLKVMNDESVEPSRRDRMAMAAAPFIHARPGEGKGKKAEKDERAKAASAGRFAPNAPPSLKAVK